MVTRFVKKGDTKMGKKRGRPKGRMPGSKISTIRARVTPEEKKDLAMRVAMCGMDTSEYIRRLVELDKKEGYICKY